jgi:hypothetical protein
MSVLLAFPQQYQDKCEGKGLRDLDAITLEDAG